jgi:hypothetical protein
MTRFLRKLHLHLGVFFSPLLLFFILTGWYQTANPDRRKGVNDSDDWASRLARVHVEQYFPSKAAEGYSTKLCTALVVVMSIALSITILLGVYLAFRSLKNPWLVALSFLLGIGVPALILRLSQTR